MYFLSQTQKCFKTYVIGNSNNVLVGTDFFTLPKAYVCVAFKGIDKRIVFARGEEIQAGKSFHISDCATIFVHIAFYVGIIHYKGYHFVARIGYIDHYFVELAAYAYFVLAYLGFLGR